MTIDDEIVGDGFVWLGFGNLWPLGLIALAVYLIPAWIAALIVYWWIGRVDAQR